MSDNRKGDMVPKWLLGWTFAIENEPFDDPARTVPKKRPILVRVLGYGRERIDGNPLFEEDKKRPGRTCDAYGRGTNIHEAANAALKMRMSQKKKFDAEKNRCQQK